MNRFIINRYFLFFLLFLFFLWGCDGTSPDTNQPPFFTSSPVTTATINTLYSYDVDANDPEGDTLTYMLDIAPAGMTIDASTGLITWTPIQEADTQVVVVAHDGKVGTMEIFMITFPATNNQPPFMTSTPVTTATVNVPYSYDVDATDPDGDMLTYSLVTTVQGMTIDPATGLISWTPTPAQETNTLVTVEVADGTYTDSQDFVITFQVTPVLPVVNITQGTSYVTIQSALDAAHSGDTIQVSDGLYAESLTFPSGKIIILQSVNGPASTHIEGLSGSPAISCNGSPAGTEIIGFHIAHAAGANGCGIYHTNGSIRVSDCNIDHHSSTYPGGGGIKNDQATLTISGCTITLNSTTQNGDGGGILNRKGTIIIEGASIIAKNSANSCGGGICNDEGTMTILGSTVSENVAADWFGGGIKNYQGTLFIIGSTISENNAAFGGGIFNSWGILNISGGSIISENVASANGGGIDNYNGSLTVKASTISENSAAYSGGGIYIDPEVSLAIHIIGGSNSTDTANFNTFSANKKGETISYAQHIRSKDAGDVHGDFPNNQYFSIP